METRAKKEMKISVGKVSLDAKNCQHCGKPIQYITSESQMYCSNTCRSAANQAKKQAQAQMVELRRQAQQNDRTSQSPEFLWKVIEQMMHELATEKAKNSALEQELSRFQKVAWNLYVVH